MPEKSFCFEESQLYLTTSFSELMKYASCRPSSPSVREQDEGRETQERQESGEHKSEAIKTTPGRAQQAELLLEKAGGQRGRCEDDARTERNIDAYRHDRSVCRIREREQRERGKG